MKNYYDELEVSKTASKEVIEKAYKVLAKKYHPDTTQEENKQVAEEKFKQLSEAYETLSDNEKRKKYDLQLKNSNPSVSYEEYINLVHEKESISDSLNNLKNEFNKYKNLNKLNAQEQSYNKKPNYTSVNNNVNAPKSEHNHSNSSNIHTNPNKKTFYYTDTGKPASAFSYYKYKIKTFLSNLGFTLLVILFLALIISHFLDIDLLSYILNLIKNNIKTLFDNFLPYIKISQ